MERVCELPECEVTFDDYTGGRPRKFCSIEHTRLFHDRQHNPKKLKICALPECDVEFEPTTNNQKYCTPAHASKVAHRRRYGRIRKKAVLRRCELPECDKTFETRRIDEPNAQWYCSRSHKEKHKRDLKRAAKPKVDPTYRYCELPECNNYFEALTVGGNAKRYCSREHMKQDKMRKWQEANPGKMVENAIAYRSTDEGYAKQRAANSRVGAKNRGAVIDPNLTSAILADILLNALTCNHCERELDLRTERIIEHKLAICNGGKHEESNIQILCADCHKIKTALDLLDAWDARAAS